jgi:Holliday junction DNA helicase RuvA
MINHINGTLISKSPLNAVVECVGIGFDLKIPLSTYESLPSVSNPCTLYSYLHISQDDVKLFGFSTPSERELFLLLIGVSGVGPKIALSVLSSMPISTFVKAIERGEEAIISKVPGLGKKSAQRLIIELKDKALKLVDYIDTKDYTVGDSRVFEVESALESLGFNSREIRHELGLMDPEILALPMEQVIKETIKRIYQKRK